MAAAPGIDRQTHDGTWKNAPILPTIGGALARHLREIIDAGIERGLRLSVFAKIGDSITAAPQFLTRLACGQARPDAHAHLSSTIEFFSQTVFPADYAPASCGVANSFSRQSSAAADGWTADVVVSTDPPDPPYSYDTGTAQFDPVPERRSRESLITAELRAIRPSFALVMFGTNDVWSNPVETYESSLASVARELLARNVIPVLYTIPPGRWDTRDAPPVDAWNAVVVRLAETLRLPLVNLWRALSEPHMVECGISSDLVHPSVAPGHDEPATRAVDFRTGALRFGYNVRNLATLETLARLTNPLTEARPDAISSPVIEGNCEVI